MRAVGILAALWVVFHGLWFRVTHCTWIGNTLCIKRLANMTMHCQEKQGSAPEGSSDSASLLSNLGVVEVHSLKKSRDHPDKLTRAYMTLYAPTYPSNQAFHLQKLVQQ